MRRGSWNILSKFSASNKESFSDRTAIKIYFFSQRHGNLKSSNGKEKLRQLNAKRTEAIKVKKNCIAALFPYHWTVRMKLLGRSGCFFSVSVDKQS